jgi:hypothetical protein
MPNWCNNRVVISHEDSAKLEALASAIREGKFCDHVIPVPKDLQIVAGRVGDETNPAQQELERRSAENIAKYGVANWYDFCTSRWGTKWDVDAYEGENVVVENNTIEFGFDSAWAPPIGVYEELVVQGYAVEATYYEPGMAYVGRWDNGIDECYEYSGETSKTVREAIGEELDDEYCISESMAEWEEDNEELDADAITQKDE